MRHQPHSFLNALPRACTCPDPSKTLRYQVLLVFHTAPPISLSLASVYQELLLLLRLASVGCYLALLKRFLLPNKSQPIMSLASQAMTFLANFWEIEDSPLSEASLSPEEPSAVKNLKTNHRPAENGCFIVPLPQRENVRPLGE